MTHFVDRPNPPRPPTPEPHVRDEPADPRPEPDECDDEPRAPAALVEALRRAERARAIDPARTRAVDDAIRAAARAHLRAAPALRRTRLRRLAPLAAALAASLLVIFALRDGPQVERSAAPAAPAALAADLDGSGRVDVVDALHLARRLDSGASPLDAWDLDGDGGVSRDDVEYVARLAVRLDGGGGR